MSDFDSATKHSTKSNKKPWKYLAITLEPEGKRHQTFTENNGHLEVDAFRGIKGAELSKEEIIKRSCQEDLLTSGLSNNGRLGAASSHRTIWHIAAKEGRGHFVLEDDAHTHPRINDFINENLDRLMNIDIGFFRINTDSILQSISPAGLRSVSIFEPKSPNQEWIRNALSKTNPQKVELHRLLKAFGLCAYFISPNGAKRL